MIGTSRAVRAFAYRAPTDLRRGFDGLYALVRDELGLSPMSGDCYLFTNARRTSSKVLLWDGTGLCIFAKRLERGRFACLWRQPPTEPLVLTLSELALFLEGCTLIGSTPLSPSEFEVSTLA